MCACVCALECACVCVSECVSLLNLCQYTVSDCVLKYDANVYN